MGIDHTLLFVEYGGRRSRRTTGQPGGSWTRARYARNHDDRRKHGMICGVNVFGVLFAARFISLSFLFENCDTS